MHVCEDGVVRTPDSVLATVNVPHSVQRGAWQEEVSVRLKDCFGFDCGKRSPDSGEFVREKKQEKTLVSSAAQPPRRTNYVETDKF